MDFLKDFPTEAYWFFAIRGLNGIFFITYAAIIGWSTGRTSPCIKLRLAVAGLLEEVLHRLRRTKETDAFEDKVWQLAESQRLERSKWVFACLLHIFAALSGLLLFFSVVLLYKEGGKFRDLQFAKVHLLQDAHVMLVVGFGLCIYVRVFERYVCLRSLDVLHIITFAPLLWSLSTSSNIQQLRTRLMLATFGRLFAAGCLGRPSCTACVNVIHSTVTCVKYVTLLADPDERCSDIPVGFPMRAYGVAAAPLAVEIAIGACTWVLSILLAGWTTQVERSKLHARAALTRETTTKSLQAVVCDAVVNVSEALVLNEPSTQLGHFLVRPPPDGSFEGASFLDFVQEEDRDRVRQQITSSAVGPGTTLSISTKLIDGSAALVKVQMYCVSFIDCEDRRGYCIGILEIKDASGSPACRVDNCITMLPPEAPHGAGGPAVLDAEVLRSVSEVPPATTDGSAESVTSAVVPLVTDVFVFKACVDVSDAKLRILSTSPSMPMLVGPLEAGRSTLFDWFQHEEATFVVNLIAEAIQRYVVGERAAELAVATIGRVHLQPRHTVRAGVQYVADMSVDLTNSMDGSTDDAGARRTPVGLRFTNVGMQKASRRMRLNSLRTQRQRRQQPASVPAVVVGRTEEELKL
eukprot:TRINITY_DN13904_c0_g2_i1.p1 TRINITY_DN13904_c0_g2~~TRINITY_DN13904_c0_g2_i1.p1  ORF type:complete len:663 (+),score=69.97 TRINITY_DN13904_c0_g2_i1:86-1990(+)